MMIWIILAKAPKIPYKWEKHFAEETINRAMACNSGGL